MTQVFEFERRRIALREAPCVTVPFGEEKAMTGEELWSALPEDLRVNVKRFEAVPVSGVGTLWTRKKGPGKGMPVLYWRRVHFDPVSSEYYPVTVG